MKPSLRHGAALVFLVFGSVAIIYSRSRLETGAPANEANVHSQKAQNDDILQTWGLPLHIGESRESVFRTLGEPSLNWSEYQATHFPVTASTVPKDRIIFWWQHRGLAVEFVADRAAEIVVHGRSPYKNKSEVDFEPYEGSLLLGITAHDKIQALNQKLGRSQDRNLGETMAHEWRIPPFLISCDTWTKDAEDNGLHWEAGEILGSIVVADLGPVLEREATYQREKERVAYSGETLTAKEIFHRYGHRVVEVNAINSRGKVVLRGTGFAWRETEIITNRHVIAQARGLRCKRYGREEPFGYYLANEEQDWAVIGPTRTNTDAKALPPVPMADNVPEVGDEVVVIGNPDGLANSLSTGIVAGIRKTGSATWIQITAPISPGSSGSPVFDLKGRLVGIATMMLIDGQNLNFAAAIGQIEQGLKQDKRDPLALSMAGLPLDYYQAMEDLDKWQECKTETELIKRLASLLERYSDPDDQSQLFWGAITSAQSQPNYALAIRLLQRKIEVVGGDYGDWASLGSFYKDIGRLSEMREAYARGIPLAVATKPQNKSEDFNITLQIVSMYRDLGKLDEMQKVAREFNQRHPEMLQFTEDGHLRASKATSR